MKELPCSTCRGTAYGRFGPIEEKLVVGRISHFPYKYKCSHCKQLNVLSAVEYNKLPELTQVDQPATS